MKFHIVCVSSEAVCYRALYLDLACFDLCLLFLFSEFWFVVWPVASTIVSLVLTCVALDLYMYSLHMVDNIPAAGGSLHLHLHFITFTLLII